MVPSEQAQPELVRNLTAVQICRARAQTARNGEARRSSIRPLASYRFESWRPGPSFWGPASDHQEGPLQVEHVLLSLTGPMIVAASVLISIFLIVT
ncbi:hypothetical protein ORIO_17375 [Cereibacter azotoformans]|uniref:hypothetical protein n=1 Tax=Cereibacter azotoformans TaxID=43057 RepID=UPI001EEB3208|nr:hypothetical protein [Cereibacter azotoformans]ULB11639.1 hypothetical protein ORIO_17375 [Cereibacter azotoformans]